MPWFVNSRLDRFGPAPAAARYRPLVERAAGPGRATPGRPSGRRVRGIDAALARACAAAGELHYAIRYNDFMGVRRDYYLAEEHGIEWATAAARPVPERLAELALAAAAAEVC